MSDKLSVILELLDDGANVKLSGFAKNAETATDKINQAGKKIDFTKPLENDLDKAERKLAVFNDKVNKSFNFLAGAASFGAATIAVGKFVDISKQAIDISIQSQKANRLLAASATEAGLAYGDLAEKNKKFAELNALSTTQAASTTARIAQLARATGRPQDIDKLSTAFSDLGAARGISPADLETLIGTILSGQDEGLNRLGIADPSKLYKAYADQLGKTADQLSQFEKAQAAANAVVEKSSIFKGAAQARLASLEGQTESINAKWENLTTTFSNSFTQSYELHSFLDNTSRFVKNLTGDVDELQRKLAKGIKPTDKEISEAARPNFLSEQATTVERGFLRFMSGVTSIPKALSFGLVDPLAESSKKFAESAVSLNPEYQQIERENFVRQQINAQILQQNLQKKSADEQKKSLDDILKKEDDRVAVLQKQTELQNKISLQKQFELSTIESESQIKKAIAARDLDSLALIRETNKIEQNSLQKQIQVQNKFAADTIRNLSPEDSAKRALIEQENIAKTAQLNSQLTVSQINYQKQIQDETEKSIGKVKELGKVYNSTFDALFRQTSNSQFFAFFDDSAKAADTLKKNLAGLPPELQKVASAMQKTADAKKLFELRLDNRLSVFDLKQDAANFRNPFDPSKQANEQNEFVQRFLRNNPNYLYLQGKTEVDDAARKDILSRSANPYLSETPADRLNKSLNDRYNEIYKGRLSSDEKAAADKRFIAATQGANPLDLSKDLREKSASARENEAVRQSKYEKEDLELRKKELTASEALTKAIENLTQKAEKDGFSSVSKALIEIVDKSNGSARVLGASPKPQNVADEYNNY